MNQLETARAYLAKLPPAISGAGGHDATFRAACWLVRRGLAEGDATTLLRQWNGTHCQPPTPGLTPAQRAPKAKPSWTSTPASKESRRRSLLD